MKILNLWVWFEGYELAITTRRDLFTIIIGPRTLCLTVRGRGLFLHPGQSEWRFK